jgi:REP element-mobilizing transposase RayT
MEAFPVRKRIRLPLSVYRQGHAFFVTIATYNKHPWFHLHPRLCETAIQELRVSASTCEITIYASCIMPDHIHLLLQGSDIVSFVRLFKGRLTPKAREIEPKRKLWHRSFFDHALRKEESLSDIACYIWENPVRAAIVENPAEYPWSGSEVWPEWRGFYGRG